MADTKISALTSLAGASVVVADDVLAIVDTSVTTTKKITVDELQIAMAEGMADDILIQGSVATTTSGTTAAFTGIAAGAKRIMISFAGVSTNGTSNFTLQIGDSGGLENSAYLSTAEVGGTARVTATAYFILTGQVEAAQAYHGHITLTLVDASTFTWACSGMLAGSGGTDRMQVSGGSKSLSAVLDRLTISTVSGDTFDAGKINIQTSL